MELASTLVGALCGPLVGEKFGVAEQMTARRRRLERQFSSMQAVELSPERLNDLVDRLVDDKPLTARQLRELGWNVSRTIGDAGYCMLADPVSIERLIARIGDLEERPRRRAIGALAGAVFAMDAEPDDPSEVAGLRVVRYAIARLASEMSNDGRDSAISLIASSPQLLGPRVSPAYGLRANENFDELRAWLEPLAIPRTSWFWNALLDAQIKSLTALPRERFLGTWPHVLDAARERVAHYRPALARIVAAYAAIDQPPFSEALRDAALDEFGNPMLERNLPNWELVGEQGRHLLRTWLVEQVLDDFFRLLSNEWNTDSRRVNFWKQYASATTDVYVFIGSSKLRAGGGDVARLRRQLGERCRELASGSEHLFMLRIGNYAWLESSKQGNACYAYTWDDAVTKVIPAPHQIRRVDAFKNRPLSKEWLRHYDGRHNWEFDFRSTIRQRTGVLPERPRKTR